MSDNPRRMKTTLPDTSTPAQREHDKWLAARKVRLAYVLRMAPQVGLRLTVAEQDWFTDECWKRRGDDYDGFCQEVDQELRYFTERNPGRVVDSALREALGGEFTDEQLALRDIAEWYAHDTYYWFDTETTGLGYSDVAWEAASLALVSGESWEAGFKPIGPKRTRVYMSASAMTVTGKTDHDLWGFPLLEENPQAIAYLLKLVERKAVFLAFNAKFDREHFAVTVNAATERCRASGHARFVTDLSMIQTWFGGLSHWIEVKDTFTRALGKGRGKEARKLSLEDIGHLSGVLGPNEVQKHGALADARLMDDIARKLLLRGGEMVTKKTKAAAQADVAEETMPGKGSVSKTEKAQDELLDKGVDETMTPAQLAEYIDTLESALEEAHQARDVAQHNEKIAQENEASIRNAAVERVETLNQEVAELNARIVTIMQQAANGRPEQHVHTESEALAYTDVVINEHKISVTARQGATAETVAASVFALMDGLALVFQSKRVKSYNPVLETRLGRSMKKTADIPDDADLQSEREAEEQAKVPPQAPPQRPPQAPPQDEDGPDEEGAQHTRTYYAIARLIHEDGSNKYRFWERRNDGNLSDYPKDLTNKKDIATLEKMLTKNGADPAGMEIKKQYPCVIQCGWTDGPEIPGNKYHARYKNGMFFVIRSIG